MRRAVTIFALAGAVSLAACAVMVPSPAASDTPFDIVITASLPTKRNPALSNWFGSTLPSAKLTLSARLKAGRPEVFS